MGAALNPSAHTTPNAMTHCPMTHKELAVDSPPDNLDYDCDLVHRAQKYRQDRAATPYYALSWGESATRRAIAAEAMLSLIATCTTLREVRLILRDAHPSIVPREDAHAVA